MSNSIAPGSSADVNVKVTALTTNPNVPATYKTVILKKNLVSGVNTLTQEMMSATNTKYVIKYDYVLGDNITIPDNCILEFDGGSLNGAYNINFNNCGIINTNNSVIFSDIVGISNITYICIDWFKTINYNITNILPIVNIGNIIIYFGKHEYTANLSNLVILQNTTFKGINRDFTSIGFTPTTTDKFILALSNYCKIYDIRIGCSNINYEGDIIRLSNEFITTSSPDWVISNVTVNGSWGNGISYNKTCGIAVICTEFNESGVVNQQRTISYARWFENIIIKPINIGIRFEIKQTTSGLDPKIWCNSFLFRNIEIWANQGIYFDVQGIDGDTTRFTFDNYLFQYGGNISNGCGFYCAHYCPDVTLLKYSSWDCDKLGILNGSGQLFVEIDGVAPSAAFKDANSTDYGFVSNGSAKVYNVGEQGQNTRLFYTNKYDGNLGTGIAELKTDGDELIYKPDRIRGNSIAVHNIYGVYLDYRKLIRNLNGSNLIQKYIYQDGTRVDGEPSRGYNIFESTIFRDSIVGVNHVVKSSSIPYHGANNLTTYRLNYNMDLTVVRNLSLSLDRNKGYRLIFDMIFSNDDFISTLELVSIYPIINTSSTAYGSLQILKTKIYKNQLEIWVRTFDQEIGTVTLNILFRNTASEYSTTYLKGFTLSSTDVFQNYVGDAIVYAKDANQNLFFTVQKGTFIYQDTYNKPIWWDGAAWRTAEGMYVDTRHTGTFAQKPNPDTGIPEGFSYYCTDRQTAEGQTNGIVIFYGGLDGSNNPIWKDALGRVVS